MKAFLPIVTILLAAAPAGAGETWSTEDAEQVRKTDDYDAAMAEGDDSALAAASGAANSAATLKLVNRAARAYENAAKARPDLAEPHWRAANVLFGFLVDCDALFNAICVDHIDPKLYRRILKHWHAVEELDPLDPRITGVLFDRAIMHTKLATEEDLRASIADYEALLERVDVGQNLAITLGNLAESYMMIGDLEQSIETYRKAADVTSEIGPLYGLAVALDRDGQGVLARQILRDLGDGRYMAWVADVSSGSTFYVPDGEVFYYEALANEALGRTKEAARFWQAYLDSGAHPIYQGRARDNLKAVKAKK
jgi:tetratricopeptide (TPR) repeat protein